MVATADGKGGALVLDRKPSGSGLALVDVEGEVVELPCGDLRLVEVRWVSRSLHNGSGPPCRRDAGPQRSSRCRACSWKKPAKNGTSSTSAIFLALIVSWTRGC
ncbi:hypothetical protein [Roseomonas xinghualingensis]|uniref:hypothetical protein n=1 Tax=Roseomonas xinghualingensis TaxID=2986475 RepID=UPI0021F11820|nr:hypothetical protein [Roseomonas sp. SXEYE001]MCV4209927.1 hypothetical protein [Roseomonas sp. SXEYE001]